MDANEVGDQMYQRYKEVENDDHFFIEADFSSYDASQG